MSDREPPYVADTKARGWRFELDMERVRRSDTWSLAPPDIRPWLLMLWTVAWDELPCGSLPDDDEVIAAKLGMPSKLFSKHAKVLRRGWWRATDGRLYHDTIAERVVHMLGKRVKDAGRARDARERKAQSQATHAGVTRDAHVSSGGVQVEFDTQNPEPRTQNQEYQPPPTPPAGGKPDKPARKRREDEPGAIVTVDELVAEGVNRQHAVDWAKARRTKGLPLTPSAWAGFKRGAAEAGESLSVAVQRAAENGWAKYVAAVPQRVTGSVVPLQGRQAAIETHNRSVAEAWLAQEGAS